MELSKTIKDKTFDDYFTEVDHDETINMVRPGSLRLFHLNVRSGVNVNEKVDQCSRKSLPLMTTNSLTTR